MAPLSRSGTWSESGAGSGRVGAAQPITAAGKTIAAAARSRSDDNLMRTLRTAAVRAAPSAPQRPLRFDSSTIGPAGRSLDDPARRTGVDMKKE
jgi:hypothetical protein